MGSDEFGFACFRFRVWLGLSSFGFGICLIWIRMVLGSSGRWIGSLVRLRLVFVGVRWVQVRFRFGWVGHGDPT